MTDAIPQIDLYGELEISPLARAEVIEAAYRLLVRRRQPGSSDLVAALTGSVASDDARMQRLELAREWLTDQAKRQRYDAEIGSTREPNAILGTSLLPFGPNAPEVRRFLSDLRGLDWDRAVQLWDLRTIANADGYERALARAGALGRARRNDEFLVARDAASAIARRTLGESTLTEQVAGVVADVAGAIVVRDLMLPLDYQLLVRPWTPRGETVGGGLPVAVPPEASLVEVPAPAVLTALSAASLEGAAVRPTLETSLSTPPSVPLAPPAPPPPPGMARPGTFPRPGRAARRRSLVIVAAPLIVVIVALTALASSIGSLFAPSPAPGVAQASEQPTTSPPGNVAIASNPAPTVAPTAVQPLPTDVPTAVPEPSVLAAATDPPTPEVTPTAEPDPTRRPVAPTERPEPPDTPKPTKPPTPEPPAPTPNVTQPPVPPPTPAPTPRMCRVIDLDGVRTYWAQFFWYVAGFSGRVTFDPPVPPSYRIETQSLEAGTWVLCTSGISVGG